MNTNRILAGVWLAGAIGLFVYEHQTGEQFLRIRGTNLSVGWLLLVLCLYNLARWVSIRSSRAAQRTVQQAREQRSRSTHRPRPEAPDPNFNFTDEPPPPAPGIQRGPPSNN
jgi:hypothetical protein